MVAIMTFTKTFQDYVCEGDSISCDVEGFTCTARLYRDDSGDKPDDRDMGFWPSLDPKSAGYVGPKSADEFATIYAEAESIMQAWLKDEWHYYGIAVTVEREGVQLVDKYAHALWGIEGNYPGSDNDYFREVANDLLPEALADAKAKITKLCEAKC